LTAEDLERAQQAVNKEAAEGKKEKGEASASKM
jgi:hypothetical protein